MALIIEDKILEKVQLTGDELLTDIACYLYEKKKLGGGKARELANLNHMEFQKALAARGIPIHYTEEDLRVELENLGISL